MKCEVELAIVNASIFPLHIFIKMINFERIKSFINLKKLTFSNLQEASVFHGKYLAKQN